MLPMEHSAVLLTCINIPHGFQAFVLSIFEWSLKTGFTVFSFFFQEYVPTDAICATRPLHKDVH